MDRLDVELYAERLARQAERAVRERACDLAAVQRLQALVERARAEARQVVTGAIATSRPPSPS